MFPETARLRAAFLMSIADIFFGAIGVLIILIVLSSSRDEQRIVESFDVQMTCSGTTREALRLTPVGDTQSIGVAAWLEAIPTDRFLVRYAVRSDSGDPSCYLVLRGIAAEHNSTLETRGATQAVVVLEYWSDGGGEQ
ncbi:MAG: hypothetical protein AAF393_07475 [Pseudomonadota bacterium]